MAIGSFGNKIVFETNDGKILTPKDISRTTTGKWGNLDRFNKKARSVFLGPELQTVSFTITLDAMLGVRPRAMIDQLIRIVETGQVEYLTIGGQPLSANPWKITSVSDAWGIVLSHGELLRASVDVSLEEYLVK